MSGNILTDVLDTVHLNNATYVWHMYVSVNLISLLFSCCGYKHCNSRRHGHLWRGQGHWRSI